MAASGSTAAPDLEDFVRAIRRDKRFGPEIAEYRYLPPAPPRYAELTVHERLRAVLSRAGIARLWSHQVEAIDAVRRGANVVVMTPTASGKSLVYNLPVAESILADREARALYLFPLKGLEQDQLQNLNELLAALDLQPAAVGRERAPLRAAEIYDGDTPSHRRAKIRARPPNVICSNPDMLHLALNAFHEKWADFFRHLKYVVIDEIHAYRGVFGSNAAHVFRRLRRICHFYGANPQFIACSATIANPRSLAEVLTGLPFREISESGAPQGGRHFFFINPTGSPYTEATHLLLACLHAGLRTIVFTKARKITELIYAWAAERAGPLAGRLSPYRAGFLPRERREIERRLFDGDLLGVISTSALELGVDIGGLDACILVGYPGTIASTWQRAGRAGRHREESVIFMVALRDALDQYFMRHPEAFFGKSVEAVVIDPRNPALLRKHLPCAAQEVYLRESDAVYDLPSIRPVIDELAAAGELVVGRRGDIWFSRRRRPQRNVSIRSIGEPFSIVLEDGTRIGEVSGARVCREAHPGAIYLHHGRHFRVMRLDFKARKAICREVDVQYYTQALSREEMEILAEAWRLPLGRATVRWGSLRLTHRVVGYDRRGLFDGERLSRHELSLPESRFDTEGLWVPLDGAATRAIESNGYDLTGALHAAEHAAIKCLPLFAVCDKGDIGGLSYPLYPPLSQPTIFIYDGYEGGIGLTRRAMEVLREWLEATRHLLRECDCEDGCPSCVQDPQCGSGNEPLDKRGAIFLLDRWLPPG
ncbi:MAG TPA: DEAD/DEAH box helicase [candidate division Zixibacteria bacterium]|nr:DEAD/DEAH box helicase [candidate division Zixibacteria bacterium]